MSDVTNLVAAACAFAALFIASCQITSSSRSAREIEAMSAYRDYLSMAMDYPALADGIQGDEKDVSKYAWYVSYMLNSSEQIVGSPAYDRDWQRTITAQLCLHRSYLQSKEFAKNELPHYELKLRRLITATRKECG